MSIISFSVGEDPEHFYEAKLIFGYWFVMLEKQQQVII